MFLIHNIFETSLIKKFMRVKYNDIIDEIIDIEGEILTISYFDNFYTGWNLESKSNILKVRKSEIKPIDEGLNSHWKIKFNFLNNIN